MKDIIKCIELIAFSKAKLTDKKIDTIIKGVFK